MDQPKNNNDAKASSSNKAAAKPQEQDKSTEKNKFANQTGEASNRYGSFNQPDNESTSSDPVDKADDEDFFSKNKCSIQ